MAANDRQVGGNHYAREGKQHWDMVAEFDLDYFQGQITKYLFRWKLKGGIQDLEKARHYLDKYIEVAKALEAKGNAAASPAGRGYVDQDRESERVARADLLAGGFYKENNRA